MTLPRWRSRLAGWIEHDVYKCHPGHAVYHAVVHAQDQRGPAALQSVHHRHVPERFAPVHECCEQGAGELRELLIRTGRFQANPPDVVANVEVGIVLPGGMRQAQGRKHDALSVPGHLRQAQGQQALALLVKRSIEDRH